MGSGHKGAGESTCGPARSSLVQPVYTRIYNIYYMYLCTQADYLSIYAPTNTYF